jgi:hypothetical protein
MFACKILKVTGVIRGLHHKKSCISANEFLDHKKPSLGMKMRSVAKRTASETLAQMSAVTAMLVIAGFIFYSR